jgi:hypothetical protein
MQRLWIATALAALTIAGFVWFPGHAYLFQDTQIWVPVMEWVHDPSLLANDLLVGAAHLRMTFYDDLAIHLKRVTGADFETILQGAQLVFRFCALAGVFLIARAAGLTDLLAVLAAAVFGMGTFIVGPSVMMIEYEPVPRGFAFSLALLGLGLLAHQREDRAGWVLAGGFLFHAPAVWPALVIRPFRLALLKPLAAAALLLALAAMLAQSSAMNPLFGALSPEHEKLQRMRGSYNWLDSWYQRFLWQYVWMALIATIAYLRLRQSLPETIRPYFLWLPWIGLLCVPASYLLLDKLKWNLIPQVQPMRTLLYTTAVAILLCAIAGLKAAWEGRWWEAPLWLYLPCLLAMSPDWNVGPYKVPRLLALGLAAGIWAAGRWRRTAPVVVALACASLIYVPLAYTKAKAIPAWNSPELDALSAWARANTKQDQVFVFRDYGRRDPNHPGIFRSRALRALWVDYKGGGQVNYYEDWALEWWRRWQIVEKPFAPEEWEQWRREKVSYLVFQKPPPDLPLAFSNRRFAVVAVPPR